MTNEEIVARIQAGEEDLTETLWLQVERLIKWKANRVIRSLNGFGGVEFNDLVNSCYPALIDAVKTYNPCNGAFTTWFMFYILRAFTEATGCRTVRTKMIHSKMLSAYSLPSERTMAMEHSWMLLRIPWANLHLSTQKLG